MVVTVYIAPTRALCRKVAASSTVETVGPPTTVEAALPNSSSLSRPYSTSMLGQSGVLMSKRDVLLVLATSLSSS